MKKLLFLLPVAVLLWACDSGSKGGSVAASGALNDFIDSASYAQGLLMAEQIKTFQPPGEDAPLKAGPLAAGLQDGLDGDEAFEKADRDIILQNWQVMLQEASVKKDKADAEVNKEKGRKFLEENATKEGVQITDSGLQYKVLTEGSGPKPTAKDIVQVHYEGSFMDGRVFDSSVQRGVPAKFAVTAVIPGWTEGLQLMNEGSKYQFYIMGDLAYGDRGKKPDIPPGETLLFDVELIKINPDKK